MLRASHLLQLAVVALLGMALVMVHSAGMRIGRGSLEATVFLESRHTIYATLAIAAMLIVGQFNVRRLLDWPWPVNPLFWFVLLTIGLLVATAVPGVGITVNGATRWIPLGPRQWGLSFQPSELAKLAVVLSLAYWCARRGSHLRGFRSGFLPPVLLISVICGLIIVEDLGTAALIGLVGFSLLLAGGVRWWHALVVMPAGFAVGAMVIVSSPYRWARLVAFADPWSDSEGIGYHPIQSMLAIVQGGLAGRGLGNGVQKFGYLPEDTTDFLFAVICEELGLAGAVLVVSLYLGLLGLGLVVLRACRDVFGRVIALGVLLTIGCQALINIAVVTVVVPTKGIALPLLSAGGTGWLFTAAAVGLLVSLDESNDVPLPATESLACGVPDA